MRMTKVIMVSTSFQHALQLAIQQTFLIHGSDFCFDYPIMLVKELYHGDAMNVYG